MVRILVSFWGPAYFQGRTVSVREGIIFNRPRLPWSKGISDIPWNLLPFGRAHLTRMVIGLGAHSARSRGSKESKPPGPKPLAERQSTCYIALCRMKSHHMFIHIVDLQHIIASWMISCCIEYNPQIVHYCSGVSFTPCFNRPSLAL